MPVEQLLKIKALPRKGFQENLKNRLILKHYGTLPTISAQPRWEKALTYLNLFIMTNSLKRNLFIGLSAVLIAFGLTLAIKPGIVQSAVEWLKERYIYNEDINALDIYTETVSGNERRTTLAAEGIEDPEQLKQLHDGLKDDENVPFSYCEAYTLEYITSTLRADGAPLELIVELNGAKLYLLPDDNILMYGSTSGIVYQWWFYMVYDTETFWANTNENIRQIEAGEIALQDCPGCTRQGDGSVECVQNWEEFKPIAECPQYDWSYISNRLTSDGKTIELISEDTYGKLYHAFGTESWDHTLHYVTSSNQVFSFAPTPEYGSEGYWAAVKESIRIINTGAFPIYECDL